MPKWLHTTIGILTSILLASVISVVWLGVLEFRKVEPEILSFLRDTHSGVNTTFDNLNRNCDEGKERCGTFSDINQTLHTVRGTFGQVEVALNGFNKNQDTLFNQETQLFNHSDAILNQFQGTLTNTNEAVNGFLPVENGFIDDENQLKTELQLFQQSNSDLNNYLESKEMKGTLTNFYGFSGSLNSVSGDIAAKTHELFYPAICKGKLCWLKRVYTITRDIGPLAEPFYYGVSTYESLRYKQPY